MELTAGQILNGRYRIVHLLGSGGMGAVYFARDPVLDRDVAIKQLLPDPISGQLAAEQVRKQFLREAQIMASLHHPNLPRVTDFFAQDNQYYLVMDYIEGQTLQQVVQLSERSLSEEQVLNWADQILSALEYLHEHHLIHRDIKPANIRLTPDNRIFLVDFGLARAHDPDNPRTTTMIHGVGTAEYSPPEQYDQSSHTDERSDIYALGATLYHLLTGQAPVSVTRRTSDPQAFRPLRASNSDVSPQVEQVILRAMELERAKRYATATEMRTALATARQAPVEETFGTVTLPPADKPSTASPPRRSNVLLPIAIGVLIVIAAGVIFALISSQANPPIIPTTPTIAPHADVKIALFSSNTIPEFIVFQNTGTAPQDLTGWYLESTVGPQVFNFPSGFVLQPGQSVRIESYTGAKNDPPGVLLWSTDPIWNNAGDKAILRNAAGAVIDSRCYGNACP